MACNQWQSTVSPPPLLEHTDTFDCICILYSYFINEWKQLFSPWIKRPRKKAGKRKNSLALVSALTDFVVKIHLDLQYELQLLVGNKSSQWAVDFLTGIHGLPVVLVPQVHFVTAGRLLIVVPPTGAFLYGQKRNFSTVVDKSCIHIMQFQQLYDQLQFTGERSEMLTVKAHRLSHTDDVFYLVISIAKTKPLLLYSWIKEDSGSTSVDKFLYLYY